MDYYVIRGKEYGIKRYHSYIKGQNIWNVRGDKTELWIGGSYHDWIFTIGKQWNVTVTKISESDVPEWEVAHCGQRITNKVFRFHHPACKSCRIAQGLPPALPRKDSKRSKKNGPVTTIVSVPEAETLDINGVLTMLDNIQSQAMDIATEVDVVVKGVREMIEAKEELEALTYRLERGRQALKVFLKEE